MSIFNASDANGGSINSASSISNNSSWSKSYTNGAGATASSNMQAATANAAANAAWWDAASYNAEQARIQREWEERMANTVYQRTVKDMKAAGINPILAAGYGLGSANVGSGATASMSAPEIFMGNSFSDVNSASASQGHSESQSNGSSWNHSESGLATFLNAMGTWIDGLAGALNSSQTINIALDGLADSGIVKTSSGKTLDKATKKVVEDVVKNTKHTGILGILDKFGKGALQYEGYNVNN